MPIAHGPLAFSSTASLERGVIFLSRCLCEFSPGPNPFSAFSVTGVFSLAAFHPSVSSGVRSEKLPDLNLLSVRDPLDQRHDDIFELPSVRKSKRFHLQTDLSQDQGRVRTRSALSESSFGKSTSPQALPWVGQGGFIQTKPSLEKVVRLVHTRHRSTASKRATATMALLRRRWSLGSWSTAFHFLTARQSGW